MRDSLQNFLICNVKTPTLIQFWYWTVRTMYVQLCTYIVRTAMYVHCTYSYVRTLYVRLCTYIVRTDPYVHKTFIPNVIRTKSVCKGLYVQCTLYIHLPTGNYHTNTLGPLRCVTIAVVDQCLQYNEWCTKIIEDQAEEN